MIYCNLDLSELEKLIALGEVSKKELNRAVSKLAAAAKDHAVGLASERLHSRRETFVKALDYFKAEEGVYVLNLDHEARWIDDGLPARNLTEIMLKSPKAKTAKDGSKFLSIPFQHNQKKSNMTPAQQSLTATIKKELGKVGASLNGIETDKNGQAKMGLVRSMDINTKPLSTPAQLIGRGPPGQVAQGITGIPILKGVSIYQKEITKKDGSKGVGRFVMTFRTISSKHSETGQWDHPGLEPVHIFEDTFDWAVKTWKNEIVPAMIASIKGQI